MYLPVAPLQAQSAVSRGFESWLNSLNLVQHDPIPEDWFQEFWQHALRCKLENSSVVQVRAERTWSSRRLNCGKRNKTGSRL